MSVNTVIIGAGPAGLMAAIAAASRGDHTTVIDCAERVGKKLLLTGSGKCNFTNMKMDASCYHEAPGGFADTALSLFGRDETIAFFRHLGIEPLNKHGGYLYPRSEQAASVLNALRTEAVRLKVTEVTACHVKAVRPMKTGGFKVLTDIAMYPADKLILATGSRASAAQIAADGAQEGLSLAQQFGHRIVSPLPALCGLLCADKEFFRACAGVRASGRIVLLVDGEEADRAEGELQLTETGLSGIPVFQISRTAARAVAAGKKISAAVDFLPDIEDDTTAAFLKNRIAAYPYPNAEALGNGLINKRLWTSVLKLAGIKPGVDPSLLSEEEIRHLADAISAADFRILRTNGFDKSQTVTGGVATDEIDPKTMQSLLVPGLFFAGEMMDVDGICGGYNLQWCWTSGCLAGRAAL